MDQSRIRNFCIIAHIDHGKSTLSDRLLEVTGTIEHRKMKDQLLDTMDLERERGITIKLQPARMEYEAPELGDLLALRAASSSSYTAYASGDATLQRSASHPSFDAWKNTKLVKYQLNLIDTPGHVDFGYEVSRSLAAVEGALLLVDSTQGVQAQTIANLYLAIEQDLTIIPVLNKIDLPNSEVDRRAEEIIRLIGCTREDIILASGKTGAGVPDILERIVRNIPAPRGHREKPFRALIFDSKYDEYKGVVAYVRAVDGSINKNQSLQFLATHAKGDALEVGYLKPNDVPNDLLQAGEIGYLVTGLKDIAAVRVGDTIALAQDVAAGAGPEPLAGYKEVKPMVYAGIFPREGNEYERLRDAIMKLRLSDAALSCEPEHSTALGFGFRCGMLGMLHLEIVQERLRREHNMEVVVTTPSVAYEVTKTDGTEEVIKSPLAFPDANHLESSREPWVTTDIVCPSDYIGNVMQLVQDRRGVFKTTDYYDPTRAVLHYDMPLSSVIVDFHDKLKSVSAGYASLSYEFIGYRTAPIVRMDIMVAEESVAAFATLIHEDEAYRRGKEIVETLKETLPRQQFVIKLQASVGAKVIASERISAFRKDVTGYLYGGDVTRKMKLLEKQKKGKKRMMSMGAGSVEIPPDAFIKVLRRNTK